MLRAHRDAVSPFVLGQVKHFINQQGAKVDSYNAAAILEHAMLEFDLLQTDPATLETGYAGSYGRSGMLSLNHGRVSTPVFVPGSCAAL